MKETSAPEASRASLKVNYLRDWIYGGIDGAVTTFAVVAGVAGASLSSGVIIVLGLANLIADGFSMAASNYSGTKSEYDDYQRLRDKENRRMRDHPEASKLRVRELLAAKGLANDTLEDAVNSITSDRERWLALLMSEDHGQPLVQRAPLKSAIATFLAFLICGSVPLIPFFFSMSDPFMTGLAATGIVFFLIGAAKSHWSMASWWRSGLETFMIGMAAALLAYLVGYGLRQFAGQAIG